MNSRAKSKPTPDEYAASSRISTEFEYALYIFCNYNIVRVVGEAIVLFDLYGGSLGWIVTDRIPFDSPEGKRLIAKAIVQQMER